MRARNIHKAALTDAVTPLEEAGKEIAYQAASGRDRASGEMTDVFR